MDCLHVLEGPLGIHQRLGPVRHEAPATRDGFEGRYGGPHIARLTGKAKLFFNQEQGSQGAGLSEIAC